jgi:ATP-dependent Clp protease ATP-binding subunit ClpB
VCARLQVNQQIVETEHLFKALMEQPNGLARRVLAKAGSNPTELLEKTDAFIRRQPKVSGDSQQVPGRGAAGRRGFLGLHRRAL